MDGCAANCDCKKCKIEKLEAELTEEKIEIEILKNYLLVEQHLTEPELEELLADKGE